MSPTKTRRHSRRCNRQLLTGGAGGVVVQFHGFSWDNHTGLKDSGVQIVVTSASDPALSTAIAAALAPRWHATAEVDCLEERQTSSARAPWAPASRSCTSRSNTSCDALTRAPRSRAR